MKDTRRKKRISLTVEAEPYEDLRRLGDLAVLIRIGFH